MSSGSGSVALDPREPGSDPARPPATGTSATPGQQGLRRVAGISASLLGTQAATSLLGLAFWGLAARSYAVVEVGVAGAAVALMMLLSSLGSLGLGTLLISRLPHTDARDRRVLVRTCLLAAGSAGAVLAVAVPVVSIHLAGTDNLRPIAAGPIALAGFVAGTALMSVVLVLDQAVLTIGVGSLQFERNVTASVIKIVALIGLGVAGWHDGMSIFLAWTLGTLLSLPLVSWRTRGGRGTGGRRVDLRMLHDLRGTAMSHHALNTALQSALQVLPVIVTIAVSAEANAYFNTALIVCGPIFALPYAIAIGVFASARGDQSNVLAQLPFTLAVSAAVSVAGYAVLFPAAAPALALFGAEYVEGGVPILQVLALAGLPFVVKDHYVALRRVQGRTTEALVILGAFLVVELVAAAAGARYFGAVGLCVAWVSVLALEALMLAVPLFRGWRGHTDMRKPPGPSAPPVPGQPARTPTASPDPATSGRPRRSDLFGPILLVMSLGVAVMAVAVADSRTGSPAGWHAGLWVLGQILIIGPPAYRILRPDTGNAERVALAVAAGMLLQISRTILSPLRYSFHDEQLHITTWHQLHDSGHLFVANPLLPVSGYYPGLEIVTDAVVRLTGLGPFVSGTLILLATRLVMMLGLIGLVRILAGSYRAAAVAAMAYLCNPQMFFFNSQYSYQTLALPLALLAVYTFLARRRHRRRGVALPVLIMVAVTLTHHLTAMLAVAAFGVWLMTEAVIGRRRGQVPARRAWHQTEVRDLLVVTVAGVVANALTMLQPGSPVRAYLFEIFTSSGDGVTGLAETGRVKPIFTDSAGAGPQPWEQALLLSSVLLTCAALILALIELRSSLRYSHAAGIVLALLALLYPIIPGGHLTVSTAEVGDRAAGFVFVGIGVAIGMATLQRRFGRWIAALLAGTLTLTFLGSVILGAGPTARQLPGPYLVSADARSMDAANLAAARWLGTDLPPGQRVYADRVAGLLAGSEGDQITVRHVSTRIDASRLLLDPNFTQYDVDVIRRARIDYLVVDTRLSRGLPHLDVYIEYGEFDGRARTRPVPAAALLKFGRVQGVDRVYDNGSLQIYDVRSLRNAG